MAERAFLDYPGLATFKGQMDIEFAKKVDKVDGKGLSTNDYTDEEKAIVAAAITDVSDKLDTSLKGAPGGLAELDEAGKVPASQLPGFVDDVVEYDTVTEFPAEGEGGKIYVAKDTNLEYRWSGTGYIEISQSLALGETASTAYRGDRGKIAYDHAMAKGSAFASGFWKIATNAEGHIIAAVPVTKDDIMGLGIPGSMPAVPTKVSELSNDAGYLTEHQDISGKVDKVAGKGLSANDYTTEEKQKLAGIATGATANRGTVTTVTVNGEPASQDEGGNVDIGTVLRSHQDISGKIDASEKGAAGGVATLGADGKVPANQLPAGQTAVSKILVNGEEAPMTSDGVVNVGTVLRTHQDISGKVDKEAGKGLSTNDYTEEDKRKVAMAVTDVSGKVDKEAGKGLSSNDYTNEDKTAVQSIAGKIDATEKGAAGGVATLGADGKVPASQLPGGQGGSVSIWVETDTLMITTT